MNETTPSEEKQARRAQARAGDRAESAPARQSPEATDATPGTRTSGNDPEAVTEDPTLDEDEHEAHREAVPTAPVGH